jgi:hypothetical protein
MYWSELLALLVVGAVVLYVWQRSDFVVRAHPGRFECKGLLPVPQQQALAEFLLQDLALKKPVTIMGKRMGRRLRLWFRGPLSPGDQQRIRNILTIHR